MVAHFTMRTYGVNQATRLVEGIWLHLNRCFFQGDYKLNNRNILYVERG